MPRNQAVFKKCAKKYQPLGITIIYEDRDILVADKSCGLLTVSNTRQTENTAYFRLNQYVRKGNHKSRKRVFIVHRLDRETSGVIVFAKNEKAKQFLQAEWSVFKKMYYVIVEGFLREKTGIITSYLAENRFHKMYTAKGPKDGKLARTGYTVLRETHLYSLLEIDLLTGRKNQIRAHFSEQGCPVAGDKKYGGKKKGIKRLALHAASMTILHPHTKEKLTFHVDMPKYFLKILSVRPAV